MNQCIERIQSRKAWLQRLQRRLHERCRAAQDIEFGTHEKIPRFDLVTQVIDKVRKSEHALSALDDDLEVA